MLSISTRKNNHIYKKISLIHLYSFILGRLSQRFFQNHIGCGITLSTISLSVFGQLYECQRHVVLWRTENQGFFHGSTKLWVLILGGSIWKHSYRYGSVSRYLLKCLTYNIKRGGSGSMSVRMHLLLWDTMKHTYHTVYWQTNE